jgi:dipeptidyl aminopeptidase/acylaminoacyl peptidase
MLAIYRSAFFLMVLGLAAQSADAPKFPDNEDMRHFRSLNAPRLSPDGQHVLIRIIDATADGAKSHLWLADIAQNTCRQITYSPDSDKTGELAGEWMPDGGSILFLAHRGEHTQLFRLPTTGGEAKPYDLKVLPPADASKLPNALPPPASKSTGAPEKPEPLPIDIASFEVAPDGETIAFVAKDPKTPGEKKQTDAKADASWVDHEIHGSRLYLLDPETSKITSVAIPADVHSATFALDSSRLLAISEESNGASDLKPSAMAWVVKLSDPANPSKLADMPASIQSVAWSSDGSSIALLAQAEHDTPPGYRDLFAYDFGTHAIRNLTPNFAGSLGFQSPIALPDKSLLLPVNKSVTSTLLRLRAGHELEVLQFPSPVAGSFNTNAKHTGWVFLGNGPVQPASLYYTPGLEQAPRVLQTPTITPANNQAVVSRRISWQSENLTIEGLLYLPPEASEHKVPLIVEVHGGPLGAFLDGYTPFINFLAGHSWAVLRTNPRGSTNYGPAFAAANKNDLGGGDYRDIMAGLDFVLKTEPIDAGKLALEGYSYGGEMAGFVEGKTSRFKAIISGAPVIDQYSEYGTEGDSYYDRWYFGKPWEHPLDAWRQSPLSGVSHASTPFMLLQGDADSTDPLGQSQEMYRALRQMGVPVDLVSYPRENHGPLAQGIYGAPTLEPWHGFDARQRIVQFLQKAFGEAAK